MAHQKPHLKIAAEEWVPYTNLIFKDNNTFSIGGPMGQFLDIFSAMMGFSYEILRPEGALWSARLPNGSFIGMVGMLEREEVEFALGPFFATDEREAVCDFTVPVYGDYYAIFMIRPKLSNDISGFVKPFTPLVWSLILLSIFSVAVAMSFLVWAESRCFEERENDIVSKASKFAIQSLSQKGSTWLPKFDGGKVIVITWLLASFVFMSCYSGILTAMLSVPKVVIPINSLADLLKQSALPWKIEAGTMMHQYLQESEDEVKRQIYAKKAGTFVSCWRSRQEIADGEFAGICDHTSMKKIMSWDFSTTGSCHLYISKEKVYSGGILAMAFKTNSTCLPKANRLVLTLKESGIFDKWLNDQITNTTECLRPPSADRGNQISALGLESLAGIFIVLAAVSLSAPSPLTISF
ncbi:probable glutamate receptor [Macrobrachium rosenbergii]|uniref:probable glutamate receptor n=1 Tax=Macrobrachium rosenbergii TaxID=79674 RepID=UPI0034D690FC